MHKMSACSLNCAGAIFTDAMGRIEMRGSAGKDLVFHFSLMNEALGILILQNWVSESVVSLMSIYDLMIGVFAA